MLGRILGRILGRMLGRILGRILERVLGRGYTFFTVLRSLFIVSFDIGIGGNPLFDGKRYDFRFDCFDRLDFFCRCCDPGLKRRRIVFPRRLATLGIRFAAVAAVAAAVAVAVVAALATFTIARDPVTAAFLKRRV